MLRSDDESFQNQWLWKCNKTAGLPYESKLVMTVSYLRLLSPMTMFLLLIGDLKVREETSSPGATIAHLRVNKYSH